MRPLAPGWRASRTWIDGSSADKVISSFIKPNPRLTSFERLEIYNRQYWFRILDCIGEDFPGLEAVLGLKKCNRLMRAYLAKYPSTSFTLRNLGDHLTEFIEAEPKWTAPRHALALEMANFEWAQVLAFDSTGKPPLSIDDLLGTDPSQLTLGLQPYLRLVELHWPLDEFSIALKRRVGRGEASNTTDPRRPGSETDAPSPPARARACVRRRSSVEQQPLLQTARAGGLHHARGPAGGSVPRRRLRGGFRRARRDSRNRSRADQQLV